MIRAHVVDDFPRWGHRLHLYDTDTQALLMSDGSWQHVDEGVMAPDGSGLVLPRGAWDSIVAIAAPHADAGEVKELRASLELERTRVEKLIDNALGSHNV